MSKNLKTVIKSAARRLKGCERRQYMAEVVLEFFDGNARKAERELGWGRETVKKGIRELETGIICIDNFSSRGKKRTEEKMPELVDDIRSIIVSKERFEMGLKGRRLRQVLLETKGYTDDDLPSSRTLNRIIKRVGIQSQC